MLIKNAVALYRKLTAPAEGMAREDERKAVFFLSAVLGMFPVSVLMMAARLFIPSGPWALSTDALLLTAGSWVVLGLLYAVGKTKAYSAGIIASFFIILISIYFSSFYLGIILPLNMLFAAQFIGAILLSEKFMRWSTVLMILMNTVLSFVLTSLDPLDVLFGPTVYLVIGFVIATFSQRYRRQRQHDRTSDLVQREKQLRGLVERVEKQKEQLEVLTRVSQTLIELQDLESLLGIIVDQAMALLDCASGGMFLLKEENQVLEWVYSRGDQVPEVGLTLAKGEGLSGRVWETGEPLSVPSYGEWEGRSKKISRVRDAAIGVPVLWRERMLGVLVITAPQGRKEFSEQDEDILKQFAAYTAIALHNSNLYQQIQMELHERRQAEQALLEVEYRYHELFDSVPIGLYRTTPEGEIIDVNLHWLQMMGFSRKDKGRVLQMNARDFFLDSSDRVDQVQTIMESDQPQIFEIQMKTKDGRRIWARDASHHVKDEGTGRGYFEGSLVDITTEKESEQIREELLLQIQQQADQMRQIIRTVPEGVVVLNEQGVVLESNPLGQEALVALTGEHSPKIVRSLGDRMLETLLTSPPKGLWHEVSTDSRIYEVISRPVEVRPMTSGWVLVLRDVTMERRIKQQQGQQEQLAAIGQLAGGIAHDFNNILAVISMQSEIGLMEEDLPGELHERLQIVNEQTRVAADLIQQILDFSRQTTIELKDLDLTTLLEEEVRLLERTIPENVMISYTCEEPCLEVRADPTRIRQIVLNLALNARDAMPEGGELEFILDRVWYEDPESSPLAELAGEEWARLRVRDTGVGIPEKDLAHIFDPFFTTKGPGEGSGLGLAQVYGIIQQHRGEIHVESSYSMGTCFNLYLPLVESQQMSTKLPKEERLVKGEEQLVLVVEDNEATRSALVSVLKLLDYRVLEAENGYQALGVYRENQDLIDVVISDLVMPEMGGKALLYALKEIKPDVRLILLTGHLVQDDGLDIKRAGAAGWIQKPVSIKEISSLLSNVLGEA